MSVAPWPAPAKLNLFLHVTGRRADGYHELETLFQIIDWADELSIEVRPDGRIERLGGAPGVAPDEDLVVRAARILRERVGRADLGATLAVTKRIPVGAGLGGGSSDAATTLVALNALWGLGLSIEELASLGLSLGADVPLFVRGENAIARGIGADLEPVTLPNRAFAIIFPGVPVATREAFQAPELTRNSPPITMPGFPLTGVAGTALPGRNDLESVIAARHPAVSRALDWLGARGAVRMTGSGACVFAPFDGRARAAAALADLPAGWIGFAAVGLASSPLHARLAAEVEERGPADRR